MVFLAFSNTLIDSGFSTGLIRKAKCHAIEYDTVFWFNIIASFFLYWFLFFAAESLSVFFSEPQLTPLLRFIGLVIIIDSLSLVPKARLIIKIDFKTQTIISAVSTLFGGILGVALALGGFGVWSLAVQIFVRQLLVCSLLWLFSDWRPLVRFSKVAFKGLFGFGSKILGSQLIITLQNNIYYFVIGKFFSSLQLGYYTRAEQFNAIVTNSITGAMERVFFPVLASVQNEKLRLLEILRRTLRTSFFVTYISLASMAIVSKPLIYILIGPKWEPAVIYLQLLCIGSIFYPFNVVNLNILKIYSRSDLILRLQIIKTTLTALNILIGVFFGIIAMLVTRIITTLIATYLNSRFSGKLMGYTIKDQIRDIWPYFVRETLIIAVLIGLAFIPCNIYFILLLQVIFGVLLFALVFEKSKLAEYQEIRRLLLKSNSSEVILN